MRRLLSFSSIILLIFILFPPALEACYPDEGHDIVFDDDYADAFENGYDDHFQNGYDDAFENDMLAGMAAHGEL